MLKFTHKKSNKAQQEIFGLLMIVILIFVGMFLIIKYSVLAPIPNVKENYIYEQLSSNTLLATTTDCDNLDIRQLIADCGNFEDFLSSNRKNCDSSSPPKYSCQYVNETINRILTTTLGQWQPDKYELEIRFPNNNPQPILVPVNGGLKCGANSQIRASVFNIPCDRGNIEIILRLCKPREEK